MTTIDVFTFRGTGETLGAFSGMCGAVARLLDPATFRVRDIAYPATIGRVGAKQGQPGYSLDRSVELAVQSAAQATIATPNRVGLISYSLGGIAVSRFLEDVEREIYTNANGSKLDIAFVVNIANPARARGDRHGVIPAPGYGLHSSHGKWPDSTVVYELANPHDLMCSAPADSPVRKIAGALSPYAALEARETDPFADLKNIRNTDWLAKFRPGRYTEAALGLGGYLIPYGTPPRTQHTMYAFEKVPGTTLTWTEWAAAEINRGWATK